jgi:hypothetical protein
MHRMPQDPGVETRADRESDLAIEEPCASTRSNLTGSVVAGDSMVVNGEPEVIALVVEDPIVRTPSPTWLPWTAPCTCPCESPWEHVSCVRTSGSA